MSDSVLNAQALCKSFHDGTQNLDVLKSVNVSIQAGESVAIVGASGSGKSTLLHLLGGLDQPSSGKVELMSSDLSRCSEKKLTQLRSKYLGFVYQFHHLLPEFTALENVMMPLRIQRVKKSIAREKAVALLEQVGLSHRLEHKPAELSGGERQRVAIARALVTEPACILADEPTGNLDSHTADEIFQTLVNMQKEHETALVIVTHDPKLAAKMDRTLTMKDGCLQSDKTA